MTELNVYKVAFEDGRIERVHGRWAAHAWANAKAIWPEREIHGLSLIGKWSGHPDKSS